MDFDKLKPQDNAPADPLVGWVMEHVDAWVDWREQNYKARWDEYYRLWRGIHKEIDKTRKSERSKLISPALQQAIEVCVAELEEALFSKKRWLDIDKTTIDDPRVQKAMGMYIDRLLVQYDINKVPDAVAEVALLGAIYGTGIGKIVVENRKTRTPAVDEDGNLTSEVGSTPCVKLVPIEPNEFAIDPLARGITDALGCAHITLQQMHNVHEKMKKGIYADVELTDYEDDSMFDFDAKGEHSPANKKGWVKIVEYHGLVPREYLDPIGAAIDEDIELLADPEEEGDDEDEMVEAIVTIANDEVLLRAVENPFFMNDRGFIAYQHDRVPNRFWGRGVAEKGYAPQKALDAELRARIDSLAYAVSPMVGINSSLVPRDLNKNFKVYPGRSIFCNGNPQEAIVPINFNPPPAQSFHQSGDLERMVEMGTGSMQAAAPVSQNARNSTSSGMSMIMSASIKRNKRTLLNMEANFLDEWVKKSAWRYMQADPERYPLVDLHFVVNSTMGIMAREVETQQIVQLLNTTEPSSIGWWMLVKSLYQLSNISNREEMLTIIDRKLQESMQDKPDPKAVAAMEAAKTDRFIAENDAVFKKTKGLLNLVEAQKKEAETSGVAMRGFLDELSLLGDLAKSKLDKQQEAQAAMSAQPGSN